MQLANWLEGFDRREIHTGDSSTVLRIGGKAGAPALVLLHGFPQTHVMWQRVAERLREQFTIVIPDLRGYGDSPARPDAPDHAQASKRALAADVVAAIDTLGIDRFNLCGHDRGGRVAHRLALDFPERVLKLCVIDIAPTLDMYARTDFDFARAYYHWFHLIQPAPLPETMIGGDAKAYLHAKLSGWGSRGLDFIEPEALREYERCFCRPAAIHSACEDEGLTTLFSICERGENGANRGARRRPDRVSGLGVQRRVAPFSPRSLRVAAKKSVRGVAKPCRGRPRLRFAPCAWPF